MTLSEKIRALLKLRCLTPAQLTRDAGLSRPTMSRIMRSHVPAEDTLNRIAAVLEVAPDYLRGGYAIPAHLAEDKDDVLFLADFRNCHI